MGEFNTKLGGLLIAGGLALAHGQAVTANISGTVLDSKSGSPVAGATVTLAWNPSLTTTTDAQGGFTLSGQATSIAPSLNGSKNMSFSGSSLNFAVPGNNTHVTVDVFNAASKHVATLVNQNLASGRYTLNTEASGLRAGVYVVRAVVGGKSASFKMSTLGLNAKSGQLLRKGFGTAAGLAKTAVDVIDTLKVTKTGYHHLDRPITSYTNIFQLSMVAGLPPGDLKIVSERNMPQVAWGSNVDVQVWDGGTQLNGNYPTFFEGNKSWMITFQTTQTYSAWGFVTSTAPEDMSAWIGGTMHLAFKGTVKDISVTMASADQPSGMSTKVDASKYGYLPDNKWHETVIPVADFTGTDMSQVNMYCGLVTPSSNDSTAVFNPDQFYQVDDIYWSLKK